MDTSGYEAYGTEGDRDIQDGWAWMGVGAGCRAAGRGCAVARRGGGLGPRPKAWQIRTGSIAAVSCLYQRRQCQGHAAVRA